MRTIYILRGSPASGKSTWIEKNNLEQYTLSADKIRVMYQSPILNQEGNFVITQNNDGQVWKLLFKLLEDRMARGEFVIIDATHYKSELLNRYKDLISKYRYRAFVVDFTDVSLEELLKRNSERDEYKRVPEETIRKMCAVFEQDTEVSKKFNILKPEEAVKKLKDSLIYNYSEYDKVVFFGDIHGCYEPIKSYFESRPFDEKSAYIFLGDYLDRGIQNKEVIEFLLSIKDKKNVLLLEGNHEQWLRMYAENIGAETSLDAEHAKILKKYGGKEFIYELNKNKIRSSEFVKNTIPQIECFDKKDLRQLCRKFGQMAFIEFKGKKYFACHGGLPTTPTIFTSTEEMIKGVGKYEDIDLIYDSWRKNTEDVILIHGHRNIFDVKTNAGERTYNLCSNVEFGAPLRILEVYGEDGCAVWEMPNPVFNKDCFKVQEKVDKLETKTDNEILKELNESKLIQKKILPGGIISYNFKRDVFYHREWNDLTCKARGLFIDAKTEKVIARSYPKFFNWGELDCVKSAELKQNLVFPVKAFKKENGFLAMISYNWNTDDLLICSKSTNSGDFVELIKDQLYSMPATQLINLKKYIKENNCTLVCECVDITHDPHIIKYNKNHLFLLDIIENQFDFIKKPYEEVVKVADLLNMEVKQIAYTFDNWEDFYAFKKAQDSSYDIQYEGWVFEDVNGFMVKYKTRFYKFWKQMRAVKEKLQQGNNVKKIFSSEDEVRVFNLLKTLNAEDKLQDMSIIDVEDIYYQEHPELVKA